MVTYRFIPAYVAAAVALVVSVFINVSPLSQLYILILCHNL